MKKLKILLIAILSVCIMSAFALFAAACNKGDENVTPGGELEKPEGGGESGEGGGSTTPGGGESGEGGGEISHTHEYGELVKEVPATCTTEGMQAHYYCEGCRTYFTEQKVETTEDALKINVDSSAHTYGTKVDEVPATCTKEGMQAHYHCACGAYFTEDKVATTEQALKINVDSAAHTYGELVDEAPATCTKEGMQAHYRCSECYRYFTEDMEETSEQDLKIELKEHEYGELVEERPATCTTPGMMAHYQCSVCEGYFDDQQQPVSAQSLELNIDPAAHSWGADGKCEYCQTPKPLYTESGDGKLIYFGEYPQSEVAEEGLKVTLGLEASKGALPSEADAAGWTDYGYYYNGEVTSYMWYIDVEHESDRYRGVYFTNYRPTNSESNFYSMQETNGYFVNTAYWFKYEPIEWRVLSKSGGSAFVLSNMVLDCQIFSREGSDYYKSSIRTWLNETFYDTAFNELEKAIIKITDVDNSYSSTNKEENSSKWYCSNSRDNIFLLSYSEVMNKNYGFCNYDSNWYDPAQRMTCTPYSKVQGVTKSVHTDSSYDNKGRWWLRSPINGLDVEYINYYGYPGGSDKASQLGGIVPAMNITLD